MKILQIIQKPQLRGAEIFACQLSEELLKLGHEIDVVYLFDHSSFDCQFDLNYISLGANYTKRFWDIKAYKRLSKIIKDGQYDIVQANAGDTLKYAAISKRLYKWESSLVFRNANKMSNFIRSKTHTYLNHFFLNQTDYIISVSENCRQDIIRFYPRARYISSTGTIGTYNFSEIPKADFFIDGPIWINVGSFVPEKNHFFLIELFAAYVKITKKGHLWLVGDGKLRDELESQVKALGLKENVKFFGYRKDVIRLIKSADVMVMPSKIEGLPGVILEALSCGLPVVASNVGGIPEVIKNNLTGYCINGNDSTEYLNRILKLLSDDELKKRISKNCKEEVLSNYMIEDIAKKFENIYKNIYNLKLLKGK